MMLFLMYQVLDNISWIMFQYLDYQIFDCLLASMAAVQAEDLSASFLFVGDLNGHHREWLGSTTTNRYGVAAFDFANVAGCDQLVVGTDTHVVEHMTNDYQ